MSQQGQFTMSTPGRKPCLPVELILYTIDCLVPSNQPIPIAISSSHPLTKTLLSLIRTSRATYPTAVRYLYSHCLYIDNSTRLHKLVETLLHGSPIDHGINTTTRRSLDIPHVPLISYISSLFLRLSSTGGASNDRFVPTDLCNLWALTAATLRRLVVDIPLRDNQLANPSLSNKLREAFHGLKQLEVFCSVRDELFLPYHSSSGWSLRDPVWSAWPNLRTLALYNQDLDETKFWQILVSLKNLQTLVLTRCDGLWGVGVKEISARFSRDIDKERGFNVYIVNVESDHGLVQDSDEKDEKSFGVQIMNVPTSYYGDEDNIELCQEWVKRRILRGEEKLEE